MNRISHLLLKYNTGRLSREEAHELDCWANECEENRKLLERLTSPEQIKGMLDVWEMVDPSRPCSDMQRRVNSLLWRRNMKRAFSGAAVVAAIVVAAWWTVYEPEGVLRPETVVAEAEYSAEEEPDFSPGVTRALITDASGRKAELSAADTVTVASDLLAPQGEVSEKTENLCLDVPRGGEFKILLEDGTEVWLNADSRLYYPRTFGPEERRVRVEGEAYFSVTADSVRPFYVETASQRIRVYGTAFNVRNYSEEPEVYTTLEKGVISLGRADNIGGDVFLSPGHQAAYNLADCKVNMRVVDPEVVTSWRKGRFVFENQTLLRIMQDLSRWYDFEYSFADRSLEREVFMGSIPRYADFKTAIAIIEKCGDIRFAIEDGTVVISR